MSDPCEEIAERSTIEDLIHRHAFALDRKDWHLLDRCFAEDGQLNYEAADRPAGRYQPELGHE